MGSRGCGYDLGNRLVKVPASHPFPDLMVCQGNHAPSEAHHILTKLSGGRGFYAGFLESGAGDGQIAFDSKPRLCEHGKRLTIYQHPCERD